MVACQRQSGHDRLGLPRRCCITLAERVANNAVIHLRIESVFVEPDARATVIAHGKRIAETDIHIGLPIPFRILERDKKAAFMRGVVLIVPAAPRIDVDEPVRRDR